jgi:hypothetical protein
MDKILIFAIVLYLVLNSIKRKIFSIETIEILPTPAQVLGCKLRVRLGKIVSELNNYDKVSLQVRSRKLETSFIDITKEINEAIKQGKDAVICLDKEISINKAIEASQATWFFIFKLEKANKSYIYEKSVYFG